MHRANELTATSSHSEMGSSTERPCAVNFLRTELGDSDSQYATETYTRVKGYATTKGQMYEVKTCALLFMKGWNRGRPFQLASNVAGAGAFDDVVFKIHTSDTNASYRSTYFLQLKHKDRAQVTTPAFTAPNGGFSLAKYYNSFLTIRDFMAASNKEGVFGGEFEHCHFVLYTNAEASRRLMEKNISDRIADVDDAVKTGTDEEFIFSLSECPEIVSCLEGRDIDLTRLFLEKLKVFSGEPKVEDMDSLITNEIKTALKVTHSEAEKIASSFVEELKEWWSKKCEITVILDQNSDILNLAFSKHKLELLQQPQKTQLTLDLKFNETAIENIKTAVTENRALLHFVPIDPSIEVSSSKLIQVLEDEKKSFIFTGLECFLREKDVFLFVWRNTQKHLLVIVDNTTQSPARQGFGGQDGRDIDVVVNAICEVLQEDPNKGVVFVSASDTVFVRRLEEKLGAKFKPVWDNFQLCQLSNESLKDVLESKVLFQGKEVEKKSLIGETYSQVLSPQIIDFVVKPVIETIGQAIVATSANFFIERTMYRKNYIKKNINKFKDLNGKFAISGIAEDELHKLVSSDIEWKNVGNPDLLSRENLFMVLSSVYAERHFNELCEEHQSVHWLHMEDEQLMWKRSHGGINDVLEYIDEDQCSYSNPKTLLDISDRVVVLIDKPKTGKTTFLFHLAHQTKEQNPSDWVVLVDLNFYSDLLDNNFNKHFRACEFFSSVADIKGISSLEKEMFQHNLMNNDNVVVVLDGVDKLLESCIENFKLLLTHLLESKVKKIWVTSQESRGQLLESLLTTIAFSLKNFTTDDQKRIYEHFWKEFVKEKIYLED